MQITKDLYLQFGTLAAIYPAPEGDGFLVLMDSGTTFPITKEQKEAVFAKEAELRAEYEKSKNDPPGIGVQMVNLTELMEKAKQQKEAEREEKGDWVPKTFESE